MYNGPERRSDMSDIIGRLIKLETLQERDIEEANTWRKLLCEKFDRMIVKMDGLPCSERKGWYQSMNRQMGFMWAVIAIVLVAILGSYAAGNSDRSVLKKEIKELICSKSACSK